MVKFLDPIGRQGGGGVRGTLSGRTQKITPSRPSMPPGVTAQLGSELSKIATRYIEERTREKDRAKMQEILMAYRKGTPGEKKIIDLPESEIIKQYGDPAAKTEYGWIDPDETEEDQAMRATDARELAMPELDDQGRRFTQERLEGLAAARHVAGKGRLGRASERMLETLMMDELTRERAKKDAELAHQRAIELKGSPGSSRSEGYASRPAAALQLLNRQNLLRDDLERAILNKEGPAAIKRIQDEIGRLDVIINRSPDHRGRVAAAKAGGTGIANKRLKDYSLARNATNNIKDIDMLTSRLLSTDKNVVGFLVDLRVFRDQALAKFGSQEALARVTDTQMVNTLTGREVFPLIKALGIGARGLDTPAERKFLREVLTGDKGLTKATLLEMAAMRRKVQVRNIERWNRDFNDGSLNDFLRTNNIPSRAFAMPPPAPVHTPIDITGPISKMTAIQLNEKAKGATAEEMRQIDLRLKKLGY